MPDMVRLVEAYGKEHSFFLLYVLLRHLAEPFRVFLIVRGLGMMTEGKSVDQIFYSVPVIEDACLGIRITVPAELEYSRENIVLQNHP